MKNFKINLKKRMGENLFNHFFYYYLHLKNKQLPKLLNLKNPESFNEKILWLKMHYRYKDAHLLADKIKVKEYIRKIIGENYLIPTLNIYDRAEDINFDKLPNTFVLKANHGSGWNIICADKTKLNLEKTGYDLKKWLSLNYYDIGKEYQYSQIPPRIICEKYIENSPEKPLLDYKFFCFNGKAKFVQVDFGRFTEHKRNFYNTDWVLQPFSCLYPIAHKKFEKPKAFTKMLKIAERLSKNFLFLRVDLYYYGGKIFFGELTFHPGGGFEPFFPAEWDIILGKYLNLA